MARLPPRLRLLLLAVAVSANPAPAMFARDSCTTSGRTSCTSQGLSEGLCCPTDSKCVPLAGNTTVICCPSESSCHKIQPITCNIAEQNPTLHPDAPIKTVALGAKLPTCGSNLCCPFGYTCSSDGKSCNKDSDQSKPPQGMTSTATTTPKTPTPSSKSTSVSTSTAEASTTKTDDASHGSDASPSALSPKQISIIGGAVGGALALFLLLGIIFLCIRSRSKKPTSVSASRDKSGNSGPYGNLISGPILHDETSYRTDFIRKPDSPGPSLRRSIASFFSGPPRLPSQPSQAARLSIPNPFDSPSQSPRFSPSSLTSEDDRSARTGHIGAHLAPPRPTEPPSTQSHLMSAQSVRRGSISRDTLFSNTMEDVDTGAVHRTGGYVPGSQTLHVPGTTPNM
ncbi:hypothetical protein NOR_07262 [Metarhizium rileyi]|uniref:Mid2 domain-containing protein n=1 Tax=Metarhizium rileyi (strain RCEF 4871) TaxID=1649241 RepID=A0A166YTR4_METRR|nr:hypothetical protein NOR_07262 [Metarhizium rileyi RCEF 4871]TWU71160.1 hypothetical protein ED733_002295 [Metarhizium rileyi]